MKSPNNLYGDGVAGAAAIAAILPLLSSTTRANVEANKAAYVEGIEEVIARGFVDPWPVPNIHAIKTEEKPFQSVWNGDKGFEVRVNDRNYQRGDIVMLREVDIAHTYRTVVKQIGYIIQGRYGLPDDMCVFSLQDIEDVSSPLIRELGSRIWGEAITESTYITWDIDFSGDTYLQPTSMLSSGYAEAHVRPLKLGKYEGWGYAAEIDTILMFEPSKPRIASAISGEIETVNPVETVRIFHSAGIYTVSIDDIEHFRTQSIFSLIDYLKDEYVSSTVKFTYADNGGKIGSPHNISVLRRKDGAHFLTIDGKDYPSAYQFGAFFQNLIEGLGVRGEVSITDELE